MSDSDQVAAVRRFVEAFNRGDFDGLVADTGPETVLHEWPMAPGAGSHKGPEGMRRALESWFESWEWMQVEIEDLQEVGDRVLATFHQTAQGKGSEAEVELRSFNVWTFRDGSLIEIHLFTEPEPALAVLRS